MVAMMMMLMFESMAMMIMMMMMIVEDDMPRFQAIPFRNAATRALDELHYRSPFPSTIFPSLLFITRLNHEATCDAGGEGSTSTASVEDIVKRKEESQLEANSRQNRKQFHCQDCGQTFMLTPVESLKHRKSCGQPL